MGVDSFRPRVQGIIIPVARAMAGAGITPNASSIIAFLAAVGAGAAFYFSMPLIGVLGVMLNSFFDAMDGAIAREAGTASMRGDYLDHVLDRYADIFIICGIFAGPLASAPEGILALTGVLMSSYMGTQAQAVGVGRFYGGILGRADRLLLLILFGILAAFLPAGFLGYGFLAWLLLIFGVLGHVTAWQRFRHTWNELKK